MSNENMKKSGNEVNVMSAPVRILLSINHISKHVKFGNIESIDGNPPYIRNNDSNWKIEELRLPLNVTRADPTSSGTKTEST